MEGERLDEFPRLVATRTREVGDRWSVSTSSSEFGKKRLGARGTIESSFVRTNSSPSLFRNAEEVGLRPKWFTARDARERRNPSRFPVSTFVEAQRKTLAALHDVAARAAWREAHAMHLRPLGQNEVNRVASVQACLGNQLGILAQT